jgi:hypothetical protein
VVLPGWLTARQDFLFFCNCLAADQQQKLNK